MSQVLVQTLPNQLHHRIVTMGGPAIAAEFAQGIPTAVVVAAADLALAEAIRAALENSFFKVETTTDLCGVELGAAFKNIYAIALGMCDGLSYGTNTKSFLSVALAEMARISQALGAEPQTLYGLAGLGDLITTGFNARSRNRTLGEKLITDEGWRHFLETHTVEGVPACRALRELLAGQGSAFPFFDVIHRILFEDKPPAETLRRFIAEFSFSS
jgi:glycerol-3-phosphate dehydrogenase (NAD(P)+)